MSDPRTPSVPTPQPRLPALSLRDARPYLLAPFPAWTIGMFLVRAHARAAVAQVVYFVPVREVRARLAQIAGPGGWKLIEPAVLDQRSLSLSLSMFGERHLAIGEGEDRLAQTANGTKQCALLYGLAEYLDAIDTLEIPIGTGPDQAPLDDTGEPQLTEAIERRAREHYALELTRIAPRYGPPLEPARTPWNAPAVSLGRARGLAALLAGILDRAERAEEVPAPLASVLRGLVARAPETLASRIAARRAGPPTQGGGAHAQGARAAGHPAGQVVEIDFDAISPQRRWAA